LKDLNFLVPPELGARGRIGVDFASFETCVYTVAPAGEGLGVRVLEFSA